MTGPTSRRERSSAGARAFGRYAAAAVLLAYVVVIARSSPVGLGDMSNHLARAYIMADLVFHHGVRFGTQFQYHFLPVPYILPSLLLTSAVAELGPTAAVATWAACIFLSIPAALLLYLRVTLGTNGRPLLENEGALFLLLCATYLSTDFFFVVGFYAYQLGLACVIVVFSLVELLRRRWSSALFALYCATVAAAYLVHLSTLLFIAVILAVSAGVRLRFRSTSLRHELLLGVPIAALLCWHFGVAEHYRRASDTSSIVYHWGTVYSKLAWTFRNFHRYGGRIDESLALVYSASLLMLIRSRSWRGAFANPRVVEALALAGAFFALYFAMPFSYSEASYVDIRALAPAAFFVLLACLQIPLREPKSESAARAPAIAVALAFVLSALNLAYLAKHFADLSRWSSSYRELFADIPRRASVLPVYTVPKIWRYMDPSPDATITRQALIPYLFSANTGEPMTYFRYIVRPYSPPDDWYVSRTQPAVDWRQIACAYRYLLVTRPFDSRRIGVATHEVAVTSSAALLAVDPRACAAASGRAQPGGIARPQ